MSEHNTNSAPVVPMDDFARGFDAGYLEAAKTLEIVGPEAVWRHADFLRERAAAITGERSE